MQNFELLGEELARRGKTEAIKQLADSPEGQKLAENVRRMMEK